MLSFRSNSPVAALLPVVMGLFVCGGCSDSLPPTYETRGKVVYSDNQEPVSGGVTIVLESAKPPHSRSSAAVQQDGTFVLSSRRDGDGSIAGEHRVRFSAPPTQAAPDPKVTVGRHMDSKYTAFDTSGVTVTIKADQENDLTITVDRPEKGAATVASTPSDPPPAPKSNDPEIISSPDLDDN